MLRLHRFAALFAAALCGSVACGGSSGSGTTSGGGQGGKGSGGDASTTTGTATSAGGSTSTGTSTSTGMSTTSSTSTGSSTGSGGLFTAPNPWNTPADGPKATTSDAIIDWLDSNGGWGSGDMQIDFSITLLTADASTPLKPFTATGDFYSPDCDQVPFPVPATGAIEGEQGYSCTMDGDCHFLVVYPPTHTLYEMWRADITNGVFNGGCTAVWDLQKTYPVNLRGDGCTSADAGGFPISAMLFTADEVAAGEVPHAIRFILPNSRIRGGGVYVHPGTHTTNPTSGGANAPPYGVRFRLRGDFPLASLPSDGARVVAKALQKYGMFLADGGTIPLTAADDRFTQHKWTDVGFAADSLAALQVKDFEVVDWSNPIGPPTSSDCVRNP
jgi:hypothetical protein